MAKWLRVCEFDMVPRLLALRLQMGRKTRFLLAAQMTATVFIDVTIQHKRSSQMANWSVCHDVRCVVANSISYAVRRDLISYLYMGKYSKCWTRRA